MDSFLSLPTWALALVIFSLRITDVTLGTFRTIAVVQGRVRLSVLLGFFEVLIWLTAVAPVFAGLNSHPVLLVFYAGGFAAGNAAGILLERRLALGQAVVQILTRGGPPVVEALQALGHRLGVFHGAASAPDGDSTLIVATCPRREVGVVVESALARDPGLFYTVSPVRDYTQRLSLPLPYATGWRAVFKRK